ncbi:hypothetical protein GCM10023185_02370 [Hymenobacter saemangeumensis]|uniref:Uncharacterized protein n=1 Tax=Hymenobacter saemangeumensis TaxID=1084522 RepID=A0ABP8HYH9_9BACT
MKAPAEYLENLVFEARRPRRELQPVVAYHDAVQAVEKALADAERYKYLLMRALRRHADESTGTTHPVPTAIPASSVFSADVPVVPLYPGQERMAA